MPGIDFLLRAWRPLAAGGLSAPLLALITAVTFAQGAAWGDETAGEPPAATVCTVSLALPPGSRVVVDGREQGEKQRLAFENLAPGKEYRSRFTVYLPGGAIAERAISIRGGAALEISLADLADPGQGGSWRHPFAATRSTRAALSPDGALAAAIGANGKQANVYSVASGKKLLQLAEHEKPIRAMAFSPDGGRLVTCGEDNALLVWDAKSGARLLRITPPEHPQFAIAPLPAPRRLRPLANLEDILASSISNGLEQSLVEPFRLRYSHVHSAVFSPDGKQLLSGQFDGSVRLWDAATGRQVRQYCGPTSAYSNDVLPEISTCGFSPDGSRVAAADGSGYVRVWNTATGERLLNLRADAKSATSAQFSPAGDYLLTLGADRVARIWNPKSGEHERLLFPGESGAIRAACFDRTGQVITLGFDSLVRTWDASTGEELRQAPLAPRMATRSLLAPGFESDRFLTDGWLGYQLRETQTGNLIQMLHSN